MLKQISPLTEAEHAFLVELFASQLAVSVAVVDIVASVKLKILNATPLPDNRNAPERNIV